MWFNMIIFGLMGQIAWNVENMYFNTFLYNSVYNGASQAAVDGSIGVMNAISIMVAASAATAVITTFLIGAFSDKLGRRKIFICGGYCLWGIVTAAFGFITKDETARLFGLSDEIAILSTTVAIVIILDCVMTFMGSTSNDAAFNAWVTDVTTTKNRATAESVLAILPIAATGIVLALSGLIKNDSIGYSGFFKILGVVVTVCGIIGLFSLKDSGDGVRKEAPYLKELIYGFRPSVIKENSRLYLALASVGVFSTSVQAFFPYIFIYISNGFPAAEPAAEGAEPAFTLSPLLIAAAAIALIAVVALIIFMGKLIDKLGKERFIMISIVLFIIGLVLASFAKSLISFAIFALPALAGYGLLMIMLNAAVRDFTPPDKAGLFQGVRMIFFVLIPMCVGPAIGNIVCKYSSVPYINDYGVQQDAPGSAMFLAAAVIAVFILIPILKLKKKGFRVDTPAEASEVK